MCCLLLGIVFIDKIIETVNTKFDFSPPNCGELLSIKILKDKEDWTKHMECDFRKPRNKNKILVNINNENMTNSKNFHLWFIIKD